MDPAITDEDPDDVKSNMSKFGWDLGKLVDEKKLAFINVSPVRIASSEKAGLIQLGMQEFKLVKLLMWCMVQCMKCLPAKKMNSTRLKD